MVLYLCLNTQELHQGAPKTKRETLNEKKKYLTNTADNIPIRHAYITGKPLTENCPFSAHYVILEELCTIFNKEGYNRTGSVPCHN
jgi:hypothetical protein